MSHRRSHSVVTLVVEAQLSAGAIDDQRGSPAGESIDNILTEYRNLSKGGPESTDNRRPIDGCPNRQLIVSPFAVIVNLAATIPEHWSPLTGSRLV